MAKETIITFRIDGDREDEFDQINDEVSAMGGYDLEIDVIEIPDTPGGGPKRTKKSDL